MRSGYSCATRVDLLTHSKPGAELLGNLAMEARLQFFAGYGISRPETPNTRRGACLEVAA